MSTNIRTDGSKLYGCELPPHLKETNNNVSTVGHRSRYSLSLPICEKCGKQQILPADVPNSSLSFCENFHRCANMLCDSKICDVCAKNIWSKVNQWEFIQQTWQKSKRYTEKADLREIQDNNPYTYGFIEFVGGHLRCTKCQLQ